MKTLRTNFPYELNERSKDLTQGAPIGTNLSFKVFLNFFKDRVASKSKDAFLKIRGISKTCKNKVLKEIALFFLEKPGELVSGTVFY